jgi:CHAT domain-containing protein/tetratricopeptide (TPR) repeat protein
MRKSLIITILLLTYFHSSETIAQCPSRPQIWDLFGHIVTLSYEEQSKEFEILRKTCILCKITNDSTYTNLLSLYASSESENNNPTKAVQLSLQAIQIANSYPNLNPEHFLAKYYFYCGYHLETDGRQKEAVKHYEKSVLLGRKYKKRWSIVAQANQYLAYSCYKSGDYSQAIKFADDGIKFAHYINDTLKALPNLYEKARNLYFLGEYSKADREIKTLLPLADKLSALPELALYNTLQADIFLAVTKYNDAVKYYQITEQILEKINHQKELEGIYVNLHFAYLKKGDFRNAKRYFHKANQKIYNVLFQSRLYNNLAWSLAQQKSYKEAFLNYQKALSLLPINFQNKHSGNSPISSTIKLIVEKDYLLYPIQDKADTWLDYYKATNTKSHLTNALKTYALADSMIDFMRYEHVGEGSKLFWRQKTRGMYERAIEASYLAGDTEAAFRFFEKSKAVLLSDKLNELGANQQLTENSAKRQRTLRDSIANLQNQLASLPANDAKRNGIQRRLEQFNDDFEAFRKQLESTNPAYYRYKYDNSTPTIADFQKSISANGSGAPTVGFVSYFVGDSAIYAFCLDQKARLVRLSLHPSDYQSLANEFLSLCADRSRLNAHYPQYRALAHRLYQLLWKPLGMTASRVIISQDGVFLPFETLLVQPNQNDFLLKHHAISYTYSANFLAKNHTDLAPSLRQGDKLFHRSFVGFAPETFQPSLRQASLKGSVAALEAVEEKFWWGKTLKNDEATKAQFMRYAPHSRVIQLFTHADADSTEAVEPRIYFHDAALRLSELTQADRFAAQLLVLSACKTGVGQNQRGEGVFSLARGFAALGIPSTITTLWSVEDQPTYELTKLFYHYLDQGLPKDEALQHAKLDWINQGDTADALPSQWAGMILVGDTAPLAMDGLQFIVLGLGLLGLGILGGVWWQKKRKVGQ